MGQDRAPRRGPPRGNADAEGSDSRAGRRDRSPLGLLAASRRELSHGVDVVDQRARRVREAVTARVQGPSLMLVLGAVTGLVTGLFAAAMIAGIGLVSDVAFGAAGDPVAWPFVLLVPALGSALVGFVIRRAPSVGGSGVVTTMRTIALRGGRFRVRVPFAQTLATSLALGTGASGGREGPMVLVGAAVGSLFGRVMAVGEQQMRSLVAAGSAAAIGASFNAPIGGMLFAVEFIVGGFRTRSSVQTIVVSSVVGAATARSVIGPDVVFRPDETYLLNDVRELGLYALLGLASVLAAFAFLRMDGLCTTLFDRMPLVGRFGLPGRLAVGGLLTGLVALVVPEVLGSGETLPAIDGLRRPMQAFLDGDTGTGWAVVPGLVTLAAAKLLATSFSTGSGNAVGTFAPALFVGGALGAAFGAVAGTALPGVEVQTGAFALVGMAAVFSAQARGPLTAVVLGFELTGSYEMILPLMVAAGLAAFLADRGPTDSIYFAALRREGIVYAESEDVDILQTVQVGEVMTTDFATVPLDLRVERLHQRFETSGHHGFPVVDRDGRLAGIVSRSDVAPLLGEDGHVSGQHRGLKVGEVATRRPVTVTPSDPVFRAIRRMATLDVGRLPVVADNDHGQLVGILRRPDLVRAYQRAVTRSSGVQQRRERGRLRDLAGVRFVEVAVEPGAVVDGVAVRDVAWPERTVLTSIRRGPETLVPTGDTVLQVGDELVALTGVDADAVQALVRRGGADTTPGAGDATAPSHAPSDQA